MIELRVRRTPTFCIFCCSSSANFLDAPRRSVERLNSIGSVSRLFDCAIAGGGAGDGAGLATKW
jgi:hypothetical protein